MSGLEDEFVCSFKLVADVFLGWSMVVCVRHWQTSILGKASGSIVYGWQLVGLGSVVNQCWFIPSEREQWVSPMYTQYIAVGRLMPGFSNVRYRFYSDIDRLTSVLALHERKIAHPFDKCLLTRGPSSERYLFCKLAGACWEFCVSGCHVVFVLKFVILLASIINTEVNYNTTNCT